MSPATTAASAGTGVVLHVEHAIVPLDVQLTVAALAGVVASLFLVAALSAQSHGDVPVLLAVVALTRRDLLSVPPSAVYAFAVVLGTALGAAAKLFGIGALGQPRLALFGQRLLAMQDAAGVVAGGLVLFVAGAFLVLPRYREETGEMGRIRRQWAASCLVYTVALLVAMPLVASVLYP